MQNPLDITTDYSYFYLNQQKYFPIIQEQNFEFETIEAANTVVIKLPSETDSDLLWESERASAQRAIEQGKHILWEMDFGLKKSKILLQESSIFYSYGIALEEFINTLWRDFKHHTLGIILYRGHWDFSKRFVWTDQQQEYFLEKVEQLPFYKKSVEKHKQMLDSWLTETQEGSYLLQLFSADLFAEYFHRLISYLPETLLAFCLFDVSEVTSGAFLAQLFSKERFQHILLGLKKSSVPLGHLNWEEGACFGGWIGQSHPYFSTAMDLSTGVYLPSDEHLPKDALDALDVIFNVLSQLKIPYRVIPENLLTESWDGIDDLIVPSAYVSTQGRRKLLGFSAAGGRVVSLGESLGLSNEATFDNFKKEAVFSEALI